MSTTVKTLYMSRNKLTLVYAIFGSLLIFQTLNKDCCFVRFSLRHMISQCRVYVSHRPLRLGSHAKSKFGFDFPSEARKQQCEQETLLNSKRKIFFPSFLYFKMNASISRKVKGIAYFIHEKYRKTAINI